MTITSDRWSSGGSRVDVGLDDRRPAEHLPWADFVDQSLVATGTAYLDLSLTLKEEVERIGRSPVYGQFLSDLKLPDVGNPGDRVQIRHVELVEDLKLVELVRPVHSDCLPKPPRDHLTHAVDHVIAEALFASKAREGPCRL